MTKTISIFSILICLAGCATNTALTPKPVVYNLLTKGGEDHLQLLHRVYGVKYTVVDIDLDDKKYVRAVPVRGSLPSTPRDEEGHPITGYVFVLYVIDKEGLPKDPYVMKSTDSRLSETALRSMGGWKLKSGMYNGEGVSVMSGQEFKFNKKPAEKN